MVGDRTNHVKAWAVRDVRKSGPMPLIGAPRPETRWSKTSIERSEKSTIKKPGWSSVSICVQLEAIACYILIPSIPYPAA